MSTWMGVSEEIEGCEGWIEGIGLGEKKEDEEWQNTLEFFY